MEILPELTKRDRDNRIVKCCRCGAQVSFKDIRLSGCIRCGAPENEMSLDLFSRLIAEGEAKHSRGRKRQSKRYIT